MNIQHTPISVELVHYVGDDLDVVNAARVSFDKVSEVLTNKDKGLLQYLAKHKHHSPFNHSFLSFTVKAPIFVARQLVKHKFMPWNEVSRRYVDTPPEFYLPDKFRGRADNVKQGSSSEEVNVYGIDKLAVHAAYTAYTNLLGCGVCPEQARMVLPQNTMTEWRWSGTLGAFLDMLILRLDSHTQEETRIVAQLIAVQVRSLFPHAYSAYIGDE